MKSFLALALLISSFVTMAEDWPDWRGPHRDGNWTEKGIIQKFDSKQIKIKWSVPLEAGYNAPTISEGRVYVMDRKEGSETESVKCFDEKTGSAIWSFTYECKYESIGYPAGPRASVVIDGSRAYSLSSVGQLYCFEKATGKVIWNKDLKEIYKITMPIWGLAASPLIIDNKVVIQAGGSTNSCVVALNKLTGDECWTNMKDAASYSSPVIITQAGKKVIVIVTGENLAGLDPETGSIYWQFPFKCGMSLTVPTPVFYRNYIFVSCFYSGSLVIKADPSALKAELVWRKSGKNERETDALHCCISTPIIRDNYIYGIDSYGEMRCLDLLTGNRIWEDLTAVKKDRFANVHFVQNGEITWMFNEDGELIISKLSSDGFHEISRAKLIEPTTAQFNRKGVGVTWTHPAFANKCVFIRSDKELVCADLGSK